MNISNNTFTSKVNKRTVLSQLLQGQTSGLQAMKQNQQRIGSIVIVDRMPDEESDERVQASYTLGDGTRLTECLTYAEILAKAGNILILLPDKYGC